MEMEAVESNGSRGGGGDRRTSRKDRRVFWACVFIFVNSSLQCTAYAGVSTNLVNYLKDRLHQDSKAAANSVTNWQGTGSIMALVAAFLADAFLGRYWTIALFMLISVVAYVVLTVSAAAALESAAFYSGLYLLALGAALQPVMTSFGADQFDESDEEERRRQNSFFNWFYQTLNVGSLVGGTVLVWVQSSVSWGLGYGIPALLSVLAVAVFLAGTGAYRRHQPPGGSPITRVAQVVVAAVKKRGTELPEDLSLLHDKLPAADSSYAIEHTHGFRFLDRAAVVVPGDLAGNASPWRLCTVTQVEEVKMLLRLSTMLPTVVFFFAVTAQMTSTFVEQGKVMDIRIGTFAVPPATLSSLEVTSILLCVPAYEAVLMPLAARITGQDQGLTQLQRIGVGLALSALTMAYMALVETKRLEAASAGISIMWQAPAYFALGTAEVFTSVGLLEFYYDQSPDALKSLCTAVSLVAVAAGNYLNSAIVAVVAWATMWVPEDLNQGRLDCFFWMMAVLSSINLLAFLFSSMRYKYKAKC